MEPTNADKKRTEMENVRNEVQGICHLEALIPVADKLKVMHKNDEYILRCVDDALSQKLWIEFDKNFITAVLFAYKLLSADKNSSAIKSVVRDRGRMDAEIIIADVATGLFKLDHNLYHYHTFDEAKLYELAGRTKNLFDYFIIIGTIEEMYGRVDIYKIANQSFKQYGIPTEDVLNEMYSVIHKLQLI